MSNYQRNPNSHDHDDHKQLQPSGRSPGRWYRQRLHLHLPKLADRGGSSSVWWLSWLSSLSWLSMIILIVVIIDDHHDCRDRDCRNNQNCRDHRDNRECRDNGDNCDCRDNPHPHHLLKLARWCVLMIVRSTKLIRYDISYLIYDIIYQNQNSPACRRRLQDHVNLSASSSRCLCDLVVVNYYETCYKYTMCTTHLGPRPVSGKKW